MNRAAKILKERDNFLILPHIRPDGDAAGSAFGLWHALKKLKKTAFILAEEDEFPSRFDMINKKDGYAPKDFLPDCIIAVDVADRERLGNRGEKYPDIDLVIDHHPTNIGFGKVNLIDSSAPATGEIIYDLIKPLVEIDEYIAKCLYVAVASDTGCFSFSNTTPKIMRIGADLMEVIGNVGEINHILFSMMTIGQLQMESMLIENMSFYCDGKIAIAIINDEMMKKTGISEEETSTFSQLPRKVMGVEISAIIKESSEGARVSLRSNGNVDVSELSTKFGGGGHKCAAGMTLSGMDIKKARELVSKELIKRI
jgi:phosphoesterase RecJ-like protein